VKKRALSLAASSASDPDLVAREIMKGQGPAPQAPVSCRCSCQANGMYVDLILDRFLDCFIGAITKACRNSSRRNLSFRPLETSGSSGDAVTQI
jgi:hypothetical protein